MKKTQIVVPCYNESKRIKAEAFLGALEKDPNLSFLFVNDGSTDDTFNVLQSLKEKNPLQIGILNLEKNSGKAEAVRRGMLKSLEGSFDNIGYWDADLATPVNAIEVFCRLLDSRDAEIVMCSRVRLLGRNIQRKTARHYLGRIFATCASLLLNINIYDTQCGAKVFRVTPALIDAIRRPFRGRWAFDVDLLGRLLHPVTPGTPPCPAD